MNRKKQNLTIKEKMDILERIENGENGQSICEKFNVNRSTISRIKYQKERIYEFAQNSTRQLKNVKQIKRVHFPETEKALYNWFLDQRHKNAVITDNILKNKAKEFHSRLNPDVPFQASVGWVQNFKKRHSIRYLKVCGEKLSTNDSVIEPFIEYFKQRINDMNLCLEQIYNADETALVYKNLNDRTLVSTFEKTAPGKKSCKERLTIMPCVNATGQHKLPLMIIGKSKKPRSFKHVILPMMHYRSSKNAWQTRSLFKEWFFDVFVPLVRKNLKDKDLPQRAVLLLDNATCHLKEEDIRTDDGNIFVIYFPPHTTALLQPLDQSIIKTLKQIYRRKLLTELLMINCGNFADSVKYISLKNVVFLITEAWNEVKESVIMHGFHVLFGSRDEKSSSLPIHDFNDNDNIPIAQLYRKLAPNSTLSDSAIMEWATGAEEICRNHITDNEIIDSVLGNEEIEEENIEAPTNIDDVIKGMNTVIEWANNSLTINEILSLRKIREKAYNQKLSSSF